MSKNYFNQIILKIDNLSSKVDNLIRQMPSIPEQIRQFWQLRQDGALTQEEFDEQKERLLQYTKHGGSEYSKTNDFDHSVEERHQSRVSEEMSEVPATEEFIRPVLQWASKQPGEFAPREAIDAMANHFNLSAKARNEHKEGKVKLYECTTWSISHLKYAGLLQRMGRARYEITDAGRKEAFSSSEVITKAYLADNFPTYRIERDRASRKNKEDTLDN